MCPPNLIACCALRFAVESIFRDGAGLLDLALREARRESLHARRSLFPTFRDLESADDAPLVFDMPGAEVPAARAVYGDYLLRLN